MHRAIDGDGVQQVHVGAWRVPDDGARPAQAPHEGHQGPRRMLICPSLHTSAFKACATDQHSLERQRALQGMSVIVCCQVRLLKSCAWQIQGCLVQNIVSISKISRHSYTGKEGTQSVTLGRTAG